MALTLYCFGPGANSLKPLLTLYEKGLDFTPRQLDPSKFEHNEPWYVKLNPNSQVPALDHDGKIIVESTVICEYLEDVFPNDNPMRPADPYLRAQMRIWTKWGRIFLLVRLHHRLGPHGQPHGQGHVRRGIRRARQERADRRAEGEVAPRPLRLPA